MLATSPTQPEGFPPAERKRLREKRCVNQPPTRRLLTYARRYLVVESLDPHVNRHRFREVWPG